MRAAYLLINMREKKVGLCPDIPKDQVIPGPFMFEYDETGKMLDSHTIFNIIYKSVLHNSGYDLDQYEQIISLGTVRDGHETISLFIIDVTNAKRKQDAKSLRWCESSCFVKFTKDVFALAIYTKFRDDHAI